MADVPIYASRLPDHAGSTDQLPVAVSMGDPAGIGLEIALKAWAERERQLIPPFVVYGDPDALAQRAEHLGLKAHLHIVSTPEASAATFAQALPVRPIGLRTRARAGQPDAANASAIVMAIEEAVHDTVGGRARALVTCPIAKSVLYAGGFAHPGHTEFLAELASKYHPERTWHPVMMLACATLRVVPLTIHVPLKDVPRLISRSLLQSTVRITAHALRVQFGIGAPQIAVAGLNPHAGEGGAMGREDVDMLAPAIRELNDEGLSVSGPHPADTLFHAAARARYDAAVCMYHDQALIPIKTLAFDEGVNVTLGLPFVRTSPDHGTAFDIADRASANPSSFIEALKLAATLSRHNIARGPQR